MFNDSIRLAPWRVQNKLKHVSSLITSARLVHRLAIFSPKGHRCYSFIDIMNDKSSFEDQFWGTLMYSFFVRDCKNLKWFRRRFTFMILIELRFYVKRKFTY